MSRELFEAIKIYFPYGPEMYNVVSHFGSLVRAHTGAGPGTEERRSRWSHRSARELRSTKSKVVWLSSYFLHNKAWQKELVRRAIFIEMEPGLSRHGNMTEPPLATEKGVLASIWCFIWRRTMQ